MISVEKAKELILNSVTATQKETIPILDAEGRIISDDVISDCDIPFSDNSAMDGFAVVHTDTVLASKKNPVQLKIINEIQAGRHVQTKVEKNTAIRIMTGAPIPEGADAVIPVEDTSEETGVLKVFLSVKKHENIRFAGEDIKKGDTIVTKGHIIRPPDIGLLASINHKEIKVFARPTVGIISTGDEIVEIGDEIKPWQVRNSNAYLLYTEIKKCNAAPVYLGIAQDTPEKTKEKIDKALDCDIVITTGGVSMGKYDFVKDVLRKSGIDIVFENVKMKPGKPMVFGVKNQKLFFGLPGNPVSASVLFIQFVRPAILKAMGSIQIEKPVINAIIDEDISKKPGRKHFIRGRFYDRDGLIHVTSTGPQGSGILRSMSLANCLIIIEENAGSVKKGDTVSIQLIHHEEI